MTEEIKAIDGLITIPRGLGVAAQEAAELLLARLAASSMRTLWGTSTCIARRLGGAAAICWVGLTTGANTTRIR